MVFTDTASNVQIELLSPTTLKLSLIIENSRRLDLLDRLLKFFATHITDGDGSPNFTHEKKDGHILFTGDLKEAICKILELCGIPETLMDQISNQISKQAPAIHTKHPSESTVVPAKRAAPEDTTTSDRNSTFNSSMWAQAQKTQPSYPPPSPPDQHPIIIPQLIACHS